MAGLSLRTSVLCGSHAVCDRAGGPQRAAANQLTLAVVLSHANESGTRRLLAEEQLDACSLQYLPLRLRPDSGQRDGSSVLDDVPSMLANYNGEVLLSSWCTLCGSHSTRRKSSSTVRCP